MGNKKGYIPWNKGKHTGQIPWNKGLVGVQEAWNKDIPMTDEAKENLRIKHLGKMASEETKQKMRDNSPCQYGTLGHNYRGGKKLSNARHTAHRRLFGFNPVNEPLNIDDEVAHHCTKEYVVYIPQFINKRISHNMFTGRGMNEVNFFALNYLFLIYNKED